MNKKKITITMLVVLAVIVSIIAIVKNLGGGDSICSKINNEGIPVQSAVTSGKQKEYAEKMQTYSKSATTQIQDQIKNGVKVSEQYNSPEQVREITKVNPEDLEKYSKIAKVNESSCQGKGDFSINVKYATTLTLINPNFSSAKIGTNSEKKKEVNYKFNFKFENEEEASMYMLTLLATINEAYIKEIR